MIGATGMSAGGAVTAAAAGTAVEAAAPITDSPWAALQLSGFSHRGMKTVALRVFRST